MARRSSGGGRSSEIHVLCVSALFLAYAGRSSWSAPRHAAKKKAPAPAPQAPSPAPPRSEPNRGGFFSNVIDGLSFGGGSAIAHRAVDALMGPRVIKSEVVASEAPAPTPTPASGSMTMDAMGGGDAGSLHSKAFQECLNHFGNEISKCQFYMDMLAECRENSTAGLTV